MYMYMCLHSYTYLYGAESIEEVRVVVGRGSKASRRVLAGDSEGQYLLPPHAMQLPQQVHGRQPPVDSTQAEELHRAVLLGGEGGGVCVSVCVCV